MHADLESIGCKFGGDPAFCLREEAIFAKVYKRTDDGRRAIALAHSWNELKTVERIIKILSPSDSPNILVFRHQRSLRKSDGFTPNGGAKYKGGSKN